LQTSAADTALVTGGARGIGLEISRALAARGVIVHATTRNASSLQPVHENIRFIECDLASEAERNVLLGRLPKIGILVNNAGELVGKDLDHYDPSARDHMLQLNLIAPIELAWALVKRMKDAGGGRIVNNASIAAHIGHPDVWYGATKAGLLNATKSMARSFGAHGVVVNAVAAGPVDDTDMLDAIPEPRRATLKDASILGRLARKDEVAKCVEWLALDAPAYVNGICMDINNGAFMR
jgi:NAD(P)-dependent dehydrogenase (short-subunit alcohol dehydrogenase family)